jgi:hypothetical protein
VIAHYKENLDWVKEVRELFPEVTITIYHKDAPVLLDIFNIRHISLPNVGREAHTYLYHIINNYDILPEYTIFCQGNPFDHIKKSTLYETLRSTRIWTPFRYEEFCGVPNEDIFLVNRPSNIGNTFCSWWNRFFRPITPRPHPVVEPSHTPYNYYKVVWNAQFSVHKSLIRSRSLDFYKQLYDTVDKDSDALEAHFLERTWGNVFTDFEIVYPEVLHELV